MGEGSLRDAAQSPRHAGNWRGTRTASRRLHAESSASTEPLDGPRPSPASGIAGRAEPGTLRGRPGGGQERSAGAEIIRRWLPLLPVRKQALARGDRRPTPQRVHTHGAHHDLHHKAEPWEACVAPPVGVIRPDIAVSTYPAPRLAAGRRTLAWCPGGGRSFVNRAACTDASR